MIRLLALVCVFILGALSPAFSQIAIDGTATSTGWFSGTTITCTLTTTSSNDTIVVVANTNNSSSSATKTVFSVTASGLTFAKRKSSGSTATLSTTSHSDLDVWTAPAASALSSKVITITFSGNHNTNDDGSGLCFGISGSNSSSPFDSNAVLPKQASSTTASALPLVGSVSTSNANDILLLFATMGANSLNNPAAGWTDVTFKNCTNNQCGLDVQYKVVSATQSSVTFAFLSGSENHATGLGYVAIADAIVQAVTPTAIFFPVPVTIP